MVVSQRRRSLSMDEIVKKYLLEFSRLRSPTVIRTLLESAITEATTALQVELQETKDWIAKSNTAQYFAELETKLEEAERQRDEKGQQ